MFKFFFWDTMYFTIWFIFQFLVWSMKSIEKQYIIGYKLYDFSSWLYSNLMSYISIRLYDQGISKTDYFEIFANGEMGKGKWGILESSPCINVFCENSNIFKEKFAEWYMLKIRQQQ